MVVGVTHDELFGPTVTVGLGGVLVEVLRDAAVRVPPFGEEQARDMLAELRGRALLDGVRGRPLRISTRSSKWSCGWSGWPLNSARTSRSSTSIR